MICISVRSRRFRVEIDLGEPEPDEPQPQGSESYVERPDAHLSPRGVVPLSAGIGFKAPERAL